MLKTGLLCSSTADANNVADSYSECSRMDYAFRLFEEIPEPNPESWNLMISGCNNSFLFSDSWKVFCQMHHQGIEMDELTYRNVLSACGALERVKHGEQVYGLIMKNGFISNGYIMSGMIDLFSINNKFDCVLRVFYDGHCENVVCWNTLISGAVKNNHNSIALEIFCLMHGHLSLIPNAFTFSSVLTACAALRELELGKGIQGQTIKHGVEADAFVGTATIDFYAKCGMMSDAIKQFSLMPVRNDAQNNDAASAIRILLEMRSSEEGMNNYTFSSVLAAYADSNMFREAMQIHCRIIKVGLNSDPVLNASLITMYSNMGATDLCEIAFTETRGPKPVGIWSNILSAFVRNEMWEKAAILFKKMLEEGVVPDNSCASKVLSIIDDQFFGIQLHGYTVKSGISSDISVGSSIMSMYSKCAKLDESLKVFEQLQRKDYVSWTSMIAGFAEHGFGDKAINFFRHTQLHEHSIDEVTLISLLNTCPFLDSIKFGKEIHGFSLRCGIREQTSVGGGLLKMYAKCSDLRSARIVFKMISFKYQVSWSSLISVFAERGEIEEALQFFHDMRLSDTKVNSYTISSILGALAISHKPCTGSQLHVLIIRTGLESDPYISSSLILMYSKCGNIDYCSKVFQKILYPDLVTWTTMIHSYAQHGKGLEALQTCDLMKKMGINSDANMFVGVLSACSQSGLVEEGYFHLNAMINEYKIEPGHKHYGCMVDLLGRAGRLEEAERFVMNMPIEPDGLIWESLLAACKSHGNLELGKVAAEKIRESQCSSVSGVYVSLSNICADAGDWENVLKIRSSMKDGRL